MGKLLSVLGSVLALGALLMPAFATAQQSGKAIKNGSWNGVIVEESCYLERGLEKATSADHNACAMECRNKGRALGILTDGDGFMRIVGNFSKDKYAQLTRHIGKRVEVTGGLWPPTATVPGTAMNLVHGNYKPHQIDIATITAAR